MNFNIAILCFLAMAGSLVHQVRGQCTNFYAITPGESCDVIAQKNKITFAMLVLLNPGIETRCPFPTGFVCVPSNFQPIVQTTVAPPPVTSCVFSYRATGSDTCSTIASQFSTVVTVIAALNPSLNCQSFIPAGTTVCVPNAFPSVTTTVAPHVSTNCVFPYFARSDETCTSIANTFGVSLALFLALNPNLNCANSLGGRIVCAPFSSIPSVQTTSTVAPQLCPFSYFIKSGDTCDGISKAYGVSLAFILALNPTINCNLLQINQRICAPSATTITPVVTTPAPTSISCAFLQSVKSGETCFSIANSYSITLSQFLSLNPGINCNLLQIDQKVCAPSNSPFSRCSFGHVVVSGNTCYDISRTYGITLENLVNKNPALNCANLHIGSVLCIF